MSPSTLKNKQLYQLLDHKLAESGHDCVVRIPEKSPYFRGHFPDSSVLPGVAELQILTEIVCKITDRNLFLSRVENVGFRTAIEGEATLHLHFELTRDGRLTFQFQQDENSVARGTLRLSPIEAGNTR